MTDRRRFIQGGVALSGVVATGGSPTAQAGTFAPIGLAGFVYDSRFPEAREIAAHAARHGAQLWGISGDLFDLWSDHLDPQWRKAPAAIAGVTTYPDLFVLETMAADRRMKVVYRGEHGAAVGGVMAHALTGPAAMLARAVRAESPDLWAPLLGRAMVECPAGHGKPATLSMTTPAQPAGRRDEKLYSWIIAPRLPRTMA